MLAAAWLSVSLRFDANPTKTHPGHPTLNLESNQTQTPSHPAHNQWGRPTSTQYICAPMLSIWLRYFRGAGLSNRTEPISSASRSQSLKPGCRSTRGTWDGPSTRGLRALLILSGHLLHPTSGRFRNRNRNSLVPKQLVSALHQCPKRFPQAPAIEVGDNPLVW